MASTLDGFRLAELDLSQRREEIDELYIFGSWAERASEIVAFAAQIVEQLPPYGA